MDDQIFYDQVSRELNDDVIYEGLWTKAFAKSGGSSDAATTSIYIELRVDQLIREAEPERRKQQEELDHQRDIQEERKRRHAEDLRNDTALAKVNLHTKKQYEFDHIMFWLGWILLIGIPYMIYRKIGVQKILLVIGVSLIFVILQSITNVIIVDPVGITAMQIIWLTLFIVFWFQTSKRMYKWQAENSTELKSAKNIIGYNKPSTTSWGSIFGYGIATIIGIWFSYHVLLGFLGAS